MFNLSEDFKSNYREYLSKEFDREINEANELLENSYFETQKSFDLLERYFNAYAEYYKDENLEEAETIITGLPPEYKVNQQRNSASREMDREAKEVDRQLDKQEKAIDNSEKKTAKFLRSIADILTNSGDMEVTGLSAPVATDKSLEYDPEVMYLKATNIKDMKFPNNIIFFIKQLISWIKNLVIKFISIITNACRRLVGLPSKEDNVDITLKMNELKKLEVTKGFKAIDTNSKNKYVKVFGISSDDVRHLPTEFVLKEAEDNIPKVDGGKSYEKKPMAYMLQIDISTEMNDLQQLVSHFLNIFDNSYGSNGEYLFGTQDLQLLFDIFKKTMKQITDGTLPAYEVQGQATELVAIDKDKMRVNLEKTLVNTEKLKQIYTQIVTKINNILRIVGHKQLIAATNMGVSYKFYSAATYQTMLRLINIIDPRINDAENMEADLTKMKKMYEDLTIQLAKMQQATMALAGVTYQTIQQRTIRGLFDSARAMTQTVTLRLTTLSLYIKCLKDVRESIKNVNAINTESKNIFKELNIQ